MDIDCPECGRRVTLDANNIIPYHDNAPPLRSVCRASKEDATPVVTIIERARAEEREACAAVADARARHSRHRRTAVRAASDEAARIAKEIRARSKGGA